MNTMPFQVSRENRASLIDQVADGLRSTIATGHYRVGDTLPNLQEMAAALHVSEIITRRAVQRLTREGLLNPRRKTGIAVCGTDAKTWRGHVLYLHWSGPSMYYHSVLSGLMEERLHAANVLVSTVHVSGPEAAAGFPKVRAELGHAVSLAVIEGVADGLDKLLGDRRIPFIHLHPGHTAPSSLARRGILARSMNVLRSVCDHCRACGVRRVLHVCENEGMAEFKEALTVQGMVCETLRTEPIRDVDSPESVERGALESVRRWLATRPDLPDLLWFSDDFVARGALLALTGAGIRIPEDVQVLSWANKGLGPVFLKPLTRVEMDPKTHGEVVAKCILEMLDGVPVNPEPLELGPVFLKGETTVEGRTA